MRVAVVLVLLLVAGVGAHVAAGEEAGSTAATSAPGAPHAQAPAVAASAFPPSSPDEMLIVVAPGQTYDLAVVTSGQPLEILVRLYDGASVDGGLSGPGTCVEESFSTNVIALSTSGQTILWADCGPVAAGSHVLSISSGLSAFVGSVRLSNATFQAS